MPPPFSSSCGRPRASRAAERTQRTVLSHAEYILTLTAAAALHVKAALRKACRVDFDLLILKVVSKSRVTWAISVLILVFLGLSVLDLGPMYATDRQSVRRQTKASLNAPAY